MIQYFVEARMQSPFPGMDPYLKATTIWPDVHAGLIAAMRRQLQLDLNAALSEAYAEGRYDLRIDYRNPPPPPPLTPADEAWLAERLAAAGLR